MSASTLAGARSSLNLKLVRESRWELVTGGGKDASSLAPSSGLKMKTPEGITLTLHKGEIASQKVDVIVNSTNKSLQLDHGALSASILKTAGSELQVECTKTAPNGIKPGEVVVTSGGRLPCQYVVHGAANSWSDRQCKEVLSTFVSNCLMETHKKNLASIAFPALGCGVLGVPSEVSAEIILDELHEFCCLYPRTKLRDFRIVLYPKHVTIVQAFEKVLINRCFAMTVQTTEGLKLSLVVGDLADEKVDVIVNSAGTKLQLNQSASSRALLQRGGHRLQEECDNNAPYGIEFGEVLVTSAYELQAECVAHGACRSWSDGNDQCKQILRNFLTNSFKVVDEKKLTSISFPALGTGRNLKIPPHIVAEIMTEELLKFSQQNKRTTLKDVRYVVYFTNIAAIQAFSEVVRSSCTVLLDPQSAKADHFPLPTFWSVIRETKTYEMIELSRSSSEYKIVENMLDSCRQYVIAKIERVQNSRLYRQYMVLKRDMMKNCQGTVERRLWHGTVETAVQGINTYGFNRSYCGANGTLYGNGTYFAAQSSYSARDTYSVPSRNGEKRMYLTRVLTGSYAKGKPGLKVPPPRPGESGVLFDTVVDDKSNPMIFVVFNDCQAYPEYLVTFRNEHSDTEPCCVS